MKVLLVGGSGMVGTVITPYLKEHHSLRVLDVQPPSAEGVEYVEGSITDPGTLKVALDGCDSFINLVMKGPQGGASTEQSFPLIISNYEVNTLGLHLLLYTAQGLGIRRGVHTSTMSVHYRGRTWYGQEEDVAFDTASVYGLTKSLGEVICAYFARWFDMNIIGLRITGPRPRERFLDERRQRPAGFEQSKGPDGAGPVFATDEEDLAAAYISALEAVQVGHGRYDAVFIAGDEDESNHNLSKARRLLGWEPRSQRYLY
ncbi:MAG TPA: NAD(P)-dependent oxidoreductase [Acidimicrobiales bacterium]|nr:NAD(P)-dependent oxidoreductase [Acidimicrobiales bacterium]